MTAIDSDAVARPTAAKVTLSILLAVSFCHMLNDVMQSLLPAIYPMLKQNYGLDFWQIGLLTTAFQGTASLLQPVIGNFTDRRPIAYSTSIGMASTLIGLILLAFAGSYAGLIIGAMFVGVGSAIFHPEIVAHRANGFGRPPRLGAIAVSGRRQFRHRARTAACRVHRSAAWPGKHRVVRRRGAARHAHSVAGEPVG